MKVKKNIAAVMLMAGLLAALGFGGAALADGGSDDNRPVASASPSTSPTPSPSDDSSPSVGPSSDGSSPSVGPFQTGYDGKSPANAAPRVGEFRVFSGTIPTRFRTALLVK